MRKYRQGDVALFQVKGKPKWLKPNKDKILALGEATGHRHEVFNGEVYCDEQGNLFVEAKENTTLEHVYGNATQAEHAPVEIEQGWYSVKKQSEYEPEGWRRVSD